MPEALQSHQRGIGERRCCAATLRLCYARQPSAPGSLGFSGASCASRRRATTERALTKPRRTKPFGSTPSAFPSQDARPPRVSACQLPQHGCERGPARRSLTRTRRSSSALLEARTDRDRNPGFALVLESRIGTLVVPSDEHARLEASSEGRHLAQGNRVGRMRAG